MKKGFTLIELMIVIAIIAIIAAIAIPNLLASRIRANEATAISAIKQVATAQVTYQSGRQGRNAVTTTVAAGANGFCTNFRNLAFGVPAGGGASDKLGLISDSVGNAYIVESAPTAPSTAAGIAGSPEPYQGYQFADDQTATLNWALDFAITGSPSKGATTGNNEYWVGQSGVVFIKGVTSAYVAVVPTAGTTPVTSPTPAGWSAL